MKVEEEINSREVALRAYYQVTEAVFESMASRTDAEVSLKERRIGWKFTQRAAERLRKVKLSDRAKQMHVTMRQEDVAEVEDAVRLLAHASLEHVNDDRTFDFTEKHLVRRFESRHGPSIISENIPDSRNSLDKISEMGAVYIVIEGAEQPLTISELMEITRDWKITNKRRGELIQKKASGVISEKTPIEWTEFLRLQRLAWAKRQLIMPLPMKELIDIEETLRKRGLWQME